MAQGNAYRPGMEDDRVASVSENVKERMTAGVEQVEQMVSHMPGASVAVCFGMGFGLGVFLGTMLAGTMRPQHPASTAEKLGQSVMDAISRVLPDSISSRIHG